MRQNAAINIISFLVYLGLQVFLFDNMVLFGNAFCFVYIAFVLFLPFKINPMLMIFIAFAGGLATDLFYNTMGVNAAASVFVAFIRGPWISLITPPGGYEDIYAPLIKQLGLSWFIYYIFPLVFIHSLVLFQVESGHILLSWFLFKKVIASAVFTSTVLILIQYLFYRNVRTI
jgi:hypothetical protein